MAEPYLTNLTSIIARFEAQNGDALEITCKHFFSGAAAYVDGQIFMSLSPVGLALKLAQTQCDDLFAQGATALRYFPKAPIKKGYAVLPEKIVDREETLQKWISRSVAGVLG